MLPLRSQTQTGVRGRIHQPSGGHGCDGELGASSASLHHSSALQPCECSGIRLQWNSLISNSSFAHKIDANTLSCS